MSDARKMIVGNTLKATNAPVRATILPSAANSEPPGSPVPTGTVFHTKSPKRKRAPSSVYPTTASTAWLAAWKIPAPTGVRRITTAKRSWSAKPQRTTRHGTRLRFVLMAQAAAVSRSSPRRPRKRDRKPTPPSAATAS